MIEFIKEATWEEANKFMKELDKRNIEYGMMTEWGAIIADNVEFIIELGEEGEKNFIATPGFLQRSRDKAFVRLMKDERKEDMPNFEDIFNIIDLSDNHKLINPKKEKIK